MYDTSGTHSVCYAAPPDNDISVRIAWLKGEVERAENSAVAARAAIELERAQSMLNPTPVDEAYAWFGAFLGLFPPFAIFVRLFGRGVSWEHLFSDGMFFFWALLLLVMNVVCCVVGRKFGRVLGRSLGDPREHVWPAHIFLAMLTGLAWGAVTGAAGGAVGFGLGALFGVLFAVPVALVTFPVFAALHRIQSHGGMIEERDLWPLAMGIPLAAAALILSAGK
jgi:hypothetical protein